VTVTLYAKPGCPQCDATCRQLEKDEIGYRKIDITQDSAAYEMCTALGYASVPVVVASYEAEGRCGASEQHWSGFRPDRIDALIGVI
jgi:glutaredoxin-like protein NrdH